MLARPVLSSRASSTGTWKQATFPAAIGVALFAGVAGVSLLFVDEPVGALAYLRGEPIIAQPSVTDVGDGSRGTQRLFHLQLTNRAHHSVRVVGGTSTCSCLAAVSLPITLAPGETRAIDVGVKFRGSSGRFRHAFILLTDDATQDKVVAQFTGRVVAGSSE